MNRLDFGELVATFKMGTSKGERFQSAKPGNFDGARVRKVVDAWFAEMEDYIHAAKVGRHSTVELAQSYLKGYAATFRHLQIRITKKPWSSPHISCFLFEAGEP
jgi:hypothetical protein